MTIRSISEDGLLGAAISEDELFAWLKSDEIADSSFCSKAEESEELEFWFSSLTDGADESIANFISELPNHQ